MNYYEILGVSADATDQQIKDGYRREAMKWHPDRHEGEAAKKHADKKFKDLAVAYRTLRDPAARDAYDHAMEQTLRDEYNARQREQTRRREQEKAQSEQERQKQAQQEQTYQDFAEKNTEQSEESMSGDDANQMFLEQMLDLAFELASRGFSPEKIVSALTGLGCPPALAKAASNLASKRKTSDTPKPSASEPSQEKNTNTDGTDDFLSKETYYKAALGTHFQGYYLKAFRKFDTNGSLSFYWPNIPALLFSWVWLAYRKMWLPFFVYLCFLLISDPLYELITNNNESKNIAKIISMSLILIFISQAFIANIFYYKFINKKIVFAKAKFKNQPQQIQYLEKYAVNGIGWIGYLAISIPIIGILAAIVLPAYEDYTSRATIASGIEAAEKASKLIDAYFAEHGLIPDSLNDVGFIQPDNENIKSIRFTADNSTIEVIFSRSGIYNKDLLLVAKYDTNPITWICGSHLIKTQLMPKNCRETQTEALKIQKHHDDHSKLFKERSDYVFNKHPELNISSKYFNEEYLNWFGERMSQYIKNGKEKTEALNATINDYEFIKNKY